MAISFYQVIMFICQKKDFLYWNLNPNILGDPYQLNPVVKSNIAKDNGLEVSMMERLMRSTMYRRDKKRGFNPSLITKLKDNFRSHPSLLLLPNQFFYHNQLRNCASPKSVMLAQKITWLPVQNFPIVFHHVQ